MFERLFKKGLCRLSVIWNLENYSEFHFLPRLSFFVSMWCSLEGVVRYLHLSFDLFNFSVDFCVCVSGSSIILNMNCNE